MATMQYVPCCPFCHWERTPAMMTALSSGVPEQAPRWDLVDTESCGGGIRVFAPYLIVWGYVGIYRRKEYVGGATGGP